MLSDRFRFVFCQLEILRHCLPPSLRGILAELPESLDETYERILKQIPKSNRVHAHRLLQCLTVALRPLCVEELAEVIATDFSAAGGTLKVDETLRWEDQEQAVLSTCSSLITIVEYRESRLVQFSHFSIKEFLMSDRLSASKTDALRYHHIPLEPARTIMAQACLAVLLRLQSNMGSNAINSYPLAKYAAYHLSVHAEFEGVLTHIIDEVDELLDPDKPHFDNWVWLQLGNWQDETWHSSRVDPDLLLPRGGSAMICDMPWYPPRVSPIYYVVALGHLSLARHLISKRPQDLQVKDEQGCTPLHIAVLAGRVEVSKLLLRHSIDFDIRDIEGYSILHMAAWKGRSEVAQMILEYDSAMKVLVNTRNKNGQTPLHIASEYDQTSVVAILLKSGADVDSQDNHKMTPLLCASGSFGIGEAAQLLLEHGASFHVRNENDQTPLHLASKHNHPGVVTSLLEIGADVDAQDSNNMTPLLCALEPPGSDEAAQLLLEHGASLHVRNENGQTPLHLASENDHPGVVASLLKIGADVDVQDSNSMTPLLYALDRSGSSEAARLLLNHGASFRVRKENGRTPLHLASENDHPSVVASLLKIGADVDTQDSNSVTPLLCALNDFGSDEASQLLLAHGASFRVRDENGQTPLHLASKYDHPGVVAELLKNDADVDAQDNYNLTPLFYASSAAAQLLLERGASVHVRNQIGQTPLHIASGARWGRSEVVRLLLRFGADVDARDSHNMTPLIYSFVGPGEAAQLLLDHGASFQVRNLKGQTPLHLAAASLFVLLDVVALLLKLGADVDAQDDDHMTPLHYALSSLSSPVHYSMPSSPGQSSSTPLEVVELLLKHGANAHLRNRHGKTPSQVALETCELEIMQLFFQDSQSI
jgi:ankyrin repeat protein